MKQNKFIHVCTFLKNKTEMILEINSVLLS